jgi:hypothetical protein
VGLHGPLKVQPAEQLRDIALGDVSLFERQVGRFGEARCRELLYCCGGLRPFRLFHWFDVSHWALRQCSSVYSETIRK